MKEEQRYKYKVKRRYFQHSAREVADGAISDAVLEVFGAFDSFFVYYSYGSEADTRALIDRLLNAGKKVFLPRVEGKDIVAVQYDGDKDGLIKNSYGIFEPKGQAYNKPIDVCITPLLAVNPKGYRLGYGGGYYDRYFGAHPEILKAGIGYFLQYTDEFVQEEGDYPLDIFVCERGIINFGRQF